MRDLVISALVVVCLGISARAQDSAMLRGVVHDPQHRPIADARIAISGVTVRGSSSLKSNAEGEFESGNLVPGEYRIAVSAQGFNVLERQVHLKQGKNPILHFQLELSTVTATVQVAGTAGNLNTETSTVQTAISHKEIERTPGADQTNSLAMITDFTPGAYMVHDMLHMRGGHQVNWYLDGIPLMNTSIAANVAPMINPKDVAELQVQRGGYSSEYGDRTYGLFNVITPSGFDRNNQAELIATAGNFYSTDDQFDLGGHTDRFAYYASIDGTRSDLGLATPVSQVIHDQNNGLGGFVSVLYNATPKDQLRLILSTRGDNYQIPNTPDQQASGIMDRDLERDDLLGFSWTHSFSPGLLLTLTPYLHFNQAEYLGGPNDTPFILNDNNRSDYVGVRSALQAQNKKNSASFGFESWAQHSNSFFGLSANPGTEMLNQSLIRWANSESGFAEDQYKATSWLTLDAGLRLTHYGGLVEENAADPRLGAGVRIPRLNWLLHGYYAYYYQPPPLDSLAGPSLQFALAQGYGFIPLHGERDIQSDFGLTIPFHGWALDTDRFHTSAKNFLDHDVIGNSGIFIPLTDLGAIISGTELTLQSPRLFNRADLRIAYSNQIAEGVGPVTGGLLEFGEEGLFLLDHDQRNTVSAVLSLNLPGHMWATPAYEFGSGFLDGDGPDHLPPHSTLDLAIGKDFGENWSVSVDGTNLGNARYLLDTSNTFGGTHYVNPREVYAELRYRFHY
jgi:outer membrane receptor protein involved in Fe transport